jgi:hypothetical protein
MTGKLTVSAPALVSAAVPIVKPIPLTVTDVRFADGSVATNDDVTAAGMLVFRGSPGAAELWDGAQKTWRPAPADETLKQVKPIAAVFKPGTPPAWQATFVAIGQRDSTDADAFSAAVNGSPSYFVRALVKAKRRGVEESALSPASAPFIFVDPNADARFTTQFDTPTTKSEAAHKVRMLLKGDGLQPAGYLEIRAQPNFEVEVANCDPGGNVLAKVLLAASGEIWLTPAANARVVINGDAETNRLLYAPIGGGAKRWLS